MLVLPSFLRRRKIYQLFLQFVKEGRETPGYHNIDVHVQDVVYCSGQVFKQLCLIRSDEVSWIVTFGEHGELWDMQ